MEEAEGGRGGGSRPEVFEGAGLGARRGPRGREAAERESMLERERGCFVVWAAAWVRAVTGG